MVNWLGQLLDVMTSPSHVTVRPKQPVQLLASADPPWLSKLARSVALAGTCEAHWTFVAGGQEMLGLQANKGAARKLSAARMTSFFALDRNQSRRGAKLVGR